MSRLALLLRDVDAASDARTVEARFMDAAGEVFGACAWGFYLLAAGPATERIAVAGAPETFVEEYESFGRDVDPVHRFVAVRSAPAHERVVLEEDAWRGCALYRELSSRYGLEHILTGPIVATDGGLAGTLNFARGPGARAFGPQELVGLTALSLHVSARLAGMRADGRPARLTSREREIAALVADGLTNAEIGRRLWITENSVKQALKRMFRKLEIGSRAQLAAAVERPCASI